MIRRVRVLVVDDQSRARSSLKALLATLPEVETVGEAENGLEALRRIGEVRPDVVLMDVVMPEMDGLQATQRIQTLAPGVRVIVLSLYGEFRQEALAAGAEHFLLKGGPSQELFHAILGEA